jgi:hypothetical protein
MDASYIGELFYKYKHPLSGNFLKWGIDLYDLYGDYDEKDNSIFDNTLQFRQRGFW